MATTKLKGNEVNLIGNEVNVGNKAPLVNVTAKDYFFSCQRDREYKLSVPLIGKNKAFYKEGTEWIRSKDATIEKDRFILHDWYFTETCKGGPKCYFDREISRLVNSKGSYIQRQIITSDNCKIESVYCDSYKKGDEYDRKRCDLLK